MFVDSQSTLYIVLAISVGVLTIFLCVVLIYLILILRDTSKMVETARETVDRVNAFVVKPIAIASHVIDRVRPILETVLREKERALPRRKKR